MYAIGCLETRFDLTLFGVVLRSGPSLEMWLGTFPPTVVRLQNVMQSETLAHFARTNALSIYRSHSGTFVGFADHKGTKTKKAGLCNDTDP